MAAGESLIKIVLWDSDAQFTGALSQLLVEAGLQVIATPLPVDVDQILAAQTQPDLLLGELDCDFQSESLMFYLRRTYPELAILPVVARPTVDGAVSAIRAGAIDYLLKKSFSLEELCAKIVGIVSSRELSLEKKVSGKAVSERDASERNIMGEMLFRDPRMVRMMRLAQKAAASRATVLIQGESGTGKELLARFIRRHSQRAAKPFVAINCAALPENLLESELFGFEKGAFTGALQRKIGKFEQADGGTLLLDELGEMALSLQSKLLRVIQEGEVDRLGGRQPVPVDVRIIATTNRDLEAEVEAGKFRQDLYFRLNVIPLTIPPLRDRPQDIGLLLEQFITQYSQLNNRSFQGLSESAQRFLLSHNYPGNVRELENMIERAVVLADGPRLELEDFFIDPDKMPDPETLPPLSPESASGLGQPAAAVDDPLENLPLPAGTTLAEVERYMIYKTLRAVDSNRTHAAAQLGISIRTLRNKLKEYREKYGDSGENQ
ncbi:MAG: sigma-54-dependent Fis family transcriptional regulator [Deltaproteobacteria bacterium]|nr:sigma-54-dependent Fis family transcriptional regulator [Candidatus Tharpella aukensis]